nr:MAG TPA: minor tail protein [Caudoviricetes sp.]
MPGGNKTLSATFKAVDNFTPVVNNIAKAGKSATKEIKQFQETLNKGVSASAMENTAGTIENAFENAESESVRHIRAIENAVENSSASSSESVAKMAQKYEELQRDLQEAHTRISGLEAELERLGNETEDNSEKFETLGDSASKMGDMLKTAISGAVAFFGVSKVTEAIDSELKAVNQFQARVGASSKEMKEYRSEIKDLYNDGMGESLEDVSNSLATIKTGTNLVGKELVDTTHNALLLRDTFDFDVSESTRAVKMMMDQFSLSSETAYNLITQGAQKGLNKNDDLLDTINEYSVHFKQLGFSADEMFNMLENGAKSGTFSVDKLGDTIKEFGIRAIDGSDTTVTAFKMAGLNADSMAKKFSKGGSDAKEAFTETIKALKDMKDPIEQNTAGVNLFGTMWEDLGAKGVFAISNLNGEISSTSDALEKMNEVKYEDLGSTFTVFGRNIMSSFTEGITSDSGDLIESIRDLQEKIMPDIKEAGEVVGNIVEKGIDGIDYITKHTELFKVSLSGVIGLLSAKKAINGITGLASGLGTTIGASTKVGGALTTVASKLGSIALPATLAVGGITAVTAGFQAYTNWAKQKDLEKHFGSVSLSMQEVEDIADKIVANGNMSKIRSSLEEFSKVDTIKKNIDEAKSSIDKFDWKIDMGFKLSAEDNNDYKKSIESYISEVQSYVEQRHYSMNISAQMIFGDSKEGKEITKTLNTFYSSQETELKKCGEDLQSVINKAFEDGLLDFDEQKKIEELTAKMTKIKKAIEDNKFDANLEIIGSDYSDKKLSADSFKDMQGEVNENIETVRQANKESHQNLIIDIKNAYANNPEQMKYRLAEADKAYKIADASYVGKGVEIEANTIHNSYKQDIDKGYEVYNRGFNARNYGKQIAEAIDSSGSDVKKSYENLDNLIEMEAQNMETAWASMSSSTQKNISEMYNSLKPEQSQLTETATACIDAGKNIPESIAQGILDSAAVGAVVGNTDSIYIRTAYNMTQQNPAYAEAMLAAKESGIEVPNSIMLGIELAKPGAISKATEAGTETGAAAKNGMANTKAGVKASTENAIGNGMCEGIDNARSKIATKIQQLKSYVETALNIGGTATVTGPDGTKTSTTFEMKAKGIATNAEGGIYDSPLLTWVAEAGDAEAIIPLNNSQRAYDLWQEAGMRLGTIRGFDDSQPLNITANTSDIVNDKDVMGVYSSAVNKTIVLKLEGGGEIKIPSTMDKNEVLNLLTSNLKPVLLGIINQELFEEGDGAYVT